MPNETQGPTFQADPCWLWTVRLAAVASAGVLLAPYFAVAGLAALPFSIILFGLWLPYVFILLRLRKPQTHRQGLALALGIGFWGVLVFGRFLLPAGPEFGWLEAPFAAALLFLQALLVSSAFLAWRSLRFVKGDRGTIAKGIVEGLVCMFLLSMYFVASGLGPEGLTLSRRVASESMAVSNLREIKTAAVSYQSQHKIGYPPSLVALGPPAPNEKPSCRAADLIDPLLASGEKSGYVFTYTPGPSVEKPAAGCPSGVQAYTVAARPLRYQETGTRSFFTDETGVIRSTSEDRAATKDDPPLQ
jgi:type IV pilus assembly protein PilA